MQKLVEGLHVVVNSRIDPFILDQIIEAQPAVIQFREKEEYGLTLTEIAEHAKKVQQRLAGSGVLFAINDHVPLAVAIGADIVHVGQNDMPVDDVITFLKPGMEFGVSVQNVQQGVIAQRKGALYVGVTVWQSGQTKLDAVPEGLNGISSIASALNIPVIGIGGITEKNAFLVLQNHARGLAVAGEVNRSKNPRRKVLALNRTIYQYNNR